MRKRLGKTLTGIILTAGSILATCKYGNYFQPPEIKELDRKAAAIIPENKDSVFYKDRDEYEINGKKVEVCEKNGTNGYFLEITVNDKIKLRSEEYALGIFSAGDAREVSDVQLKEDEKWQVIENPRRFQKDYSRLIESVYNAKNNLEKRIDEESKRRNREVDAKIKKEVMDLSDKL